MPNKAPSKPRAKSLQPGESVPPHEQARSVDGLGLWAISLGVAALAVAWVADQTTAGNIGAACTLAGAAALIGLVVGGSARGNV